MIKFKLVLSFFLLVAHLQSYAQAGNTQIVQNLEGMRFEMYSNGINPTGDALPDDYHHQAWEAADITFEGNPIIKYDKVRYNLDKKVLELLIGGKVYFIAAEQINKLVFTNLNTTFLLNKEKVKLGLLEVIEKYKNMSLVIAYDIMKLSKNSGVANIYDSNPEGTKTKKYYLINADGSLFKLTNSKKKNTNFFGKGWVQVEKFIKKNKLSFKKENHIIKIMEFYGGLSN